MSKVGLNKSLVSTSQSKAGTVSTTHRTRIITVLNTICHRTSDSHSKSLGKSKLTLNKSLSKESNPKHLNNLKTVQEIIYKYIKKFEPQNASVSSRIDNIIRKSDMFLPKPYDFVKIEKRMMSSINYIRKVIKPLEIQSKTSLHKPSKSYIPNISFHTSQNFWRKKSEERTYKPKLYQDINTLISDCKEAESLIINKSRKSLVDKKSKNIKWAIKEYLANISSEDWQSKKNIDFLLNLKNTKQINKRELFNDELVNKMLENIRKRALTITGLGRKRIWKPQRYIPSRKVILANSIEELNYLYQIENHGKHTH